MAEHYDALVIGGGPGGATTALLLAQAGWSVMLLERKTFPRRKVCGEYLSATNLPLLEQLGIAEVFLDSAGPEVRRVGLFAGTSSLSADLPRPDGQAGWGRALSREHLDTLLLIQAGRAGVAIRQPWSALALAKDSNGYTCRAESCETGVTSEFRARLVVAAHGSWESGSLPTQLDWRPARPCDLLGFKAHFRHGDLPDGLMPLLAFPGGYGGMVHCDGDRVSLSCCIRRDRLAEVRREFSKDAGEAVLDHILRSCHGVRIVLAGAVREGAWLSAGPIRPGIHLHGPDGVFRVGNAAGEAHPVVAEGISMAMQSAWLLATRLIAWRRDDRSEAALDALRNDYAAAWRRSFQPRLMASSLLACWAMSPLAVAATLPLLRHFSPLLTWAARLSGKATCVVSSVRMT